MDLPDSDIVVITCEIEVERRHEELAAWWLDTAADDLLKQLPKMQKYGGTGDGSADLRVMGDALGEFSGMHDAPTAVKQEQAVWFYALGKISRLISDYKAKRAGDDDTWHDLSIYSMMARRLKAVGRWP